jgi:LPXTG-site transpeptidase (sortase) family protein
MEKNRSSFKMLKSVGFGLILVAFVLQLGWLPVQAASSPLSKAKASLPFRGNAELAMLKNGTPLLAASSMRLGAVQQSVLTASNPQALDEFGWSVAISGNTAVIGVRNADPDSGDGPLSGAGMAYIFVRSGTSWIEEARLVAKDAEQGDTFGGSVAIDGNTVVIGAPGSDIEDNVSAGAAYVFVREGITWKQKTKLVASDPDDDDAFGVSVAIDGNTIAVGADSKDFTPLVDTGAVYIYILQDNAWDQKAKLIPTDANLGNFFGTSVALSGSRLVVGATEANPIDIYGPGAAYVFSGRGNKWVQEARLSAEEGKSGDFFGTSVAISGSLIVVGAPFSDPKVGDVHATNAGAAYVFKQKSDSWEQRAELIASDPVSFAEFGQSVAVEAGTISVGAEGATQSGYTEAGSVYLFALIAQEWTFQSKIMADYIKEGGNFGKSVALSNNEIVVGATGMSPDNLVRAGQSFIFQLAPVQLPETGFAPARITALPVQPPSKSYSNLGDMWLEIPTLDIQVPIIGVPESSSGWDTTWLYDKAGYLEGTAYPTWTGNTGIAAHTVLPDGNIGPFYNLHALQPGDWVIIHGWNQENIYEVRSNTRRRADDLSVLSHKSGDWITLITCRDFDPKTGKYAWRTIVNAVWIGVKED